MASKVSTLNSTVPASWMRVAQTSMRRSSHPSTRSPVRGPPPSRSRSAFTASRYCSAAALVKKIEPTKKIAPSAPGPTAWTTPGRGPTRKHAEPMAKSTPIHHEARRGAHQTPSPAAGRESRERCLRWWREPHSTRPPSGRR